MSKATENLEAAHILFPPPGLFQNGPRRPGFATPQPVARCRAPRRALDGSGPF
jgi:hypothetical protein